MNAAPVDNLTTFSRRAARISQDNINCSQGTLKGIATAGTHFKWFVACEVFDVFLSTVDSVEVGT